MTMVLDRYESIPAPYSVVLTPAQSLAAPARMPVDLAESQWIVPLWELVVNGVAMAPVHPVGIRLRQEDGLFFAENDALAVYGSGRTPEDAIRDFKETASTFAAEYRELKPDAVIGLGVSVRNNFLKAFPR